MSNIRTVASWLWYCTVWRVNSKGIRTYRRLLPWRYPLYWTTCCHKPADHHTNFHSHENLKPHICEQFARCRHARTTPVLKKNAEIAYCSRSRSLIMCFVVLRINLKLVSYKRIMKFCLIIVSNCISNLVQKASRNKQRIKLSCSRQYCNLWTDMTLLRSVQLNAIRAKNLWQLWENTKRNTIYRSISYKSCCGKVGSNKKVKFSLCLTN
jgi:hypothetical protein